MTEIIRLQPHDPLPDYGLHGIVLRRFGEDDPGAVIVEIAFSGPEPISMPAVDRDGHVMPLEQAIAVATKHAESRGIARLYVVDRTAGEREQEVLRHHGDHSADMEQLSDTDEEDGVEGSTILDRPHDAGFAR